MLLILMTECPVLKYVTCTFSPTIKWAVTCDFQQCGILTSVDSDEPVQLPFKAAYSVTMNIFRKKKYFLFKSFAKVE